MTTQAKLPVFYRPEMVVDQNHVSPSAGKPRLVVEDWQRLGLPIDIVSPEPATEADLALAHDPAFVRGVLSGAIVNGFGTKSLEVAASLPFTTGSMLAAARHVAKFGGIACSPTSGFHHAQWSHAGGFCTFNGLVVTALALLREGAASRVSIIDCDQHYGDGTDEILSRLGKARMAFHHFTSGEEFQDRRQIPSFFRRLNQELEIAVESDVVLYQAGADPHVSDPFGGWLTNEELRLRDALVFDTLTASGTPVVWNLAGGYQRRPDGSIPDVLEIHANTAREAVRCLGG